MLVIDDARAAWRFAMRRSMVRKQPAAPGDGAGAAVVLGGSVTALSVARGLGRAGARVYALGDVRHSRYCHTFAGFANPDARQAQWLDWLEHGPRRAVILPTSD